jgi:hypothetical protein
MSRTEKESGMREATGERAKNRTNFNLSERQDKQTGRRSSDNGRTLAIITKLGLRSSSRLACYRNADLEQPITAPAIVAPHTVNNRAFGSFQVSPSRSVRRSCVIPRRRDQLRESHHRSSPLSWLKRRSGFVILRHLPHKLACRGQQAEQWPVASGGLLWGKHGVISGPRMQIRACPGRKVEVI